MLHHLCLHRLICLLPALTVVVASLVAASLATLVVALEPAARWLAPLVLILAAAPSIAGLEALLRLRRDPPGLLLLLVGLVLRVAIAALGSRLLEGIIAHCVRWVEHIIITGLLVALE